MSTPEEENAGGLPRRGATPARVTRAAFTRQSGRLGFLPRATPYVPTRKAVQLTRASSTAPSSSTRWERSSGPWNLARFSSCDAAEAANLIFRERKALYARAPSLPLPSSSSCEQVPPRELSAATMRFRPTHVCLYVFVHRTFPRRLSSIVLLTVR